jgi:hypothetical protein
MGAVVEKRVFVRKDVVAVGAEKRAFDEQAFVEFARVKVGAQETAIFKPAIQKLGACQVGAGKRAPRKDAGVKLCPPQVALRKRTLLVNGQRRFLSPKTLFGRPNLPNHNRPKIFIFHILFSFTVMQSYNRFSFPQNIWAKKVEKVFHIFFNRRNKARPDLRKASTGRFRRFQTSDRLRGGG